MYPYPTPRYVRYGPRYLTQVLETLGMDHDTLPTVSVRYDMYAAKILTQVLGTLGTDHDTLPQF